MKISIYSIRHLKNITRQALSPVTRIFRICPECALSACGEVALFSSVWVRRFRKFHSDYVQHSIHNTFSFSEVSENDTLKLLCRLKESKAAGPDKINAKLVKDSAEVSCPTLTKIFNRSLQQGIFPEELKTVFVSPIYKNGDKSDCSDYRPISILSTIAKILEKNCLQSVNFVYK